MDKTNNHEIKNSKILSLNVRIILRMLVVKNETITEKKNHMHYKRNICISYIYILKLESC